VDWYVPSCEEPEASCKARRADYISVTVSPIVKDAWILDASQRIKGRIFDFANSIFSIYLRLDLVSADNQRVTNIRKMMCRTLVPHV